MVRKKRKPKRKPKAKVVNLRNKAKLANSTAAINSVLSRDRQLSALAHAEYRSMVAVPAAMPKGGDVLPLPLPTDPITAIAAYGIPAICHLAEKVIDGQPKEVQAELWKMHLEDVKAWRAFWHLP